jgi:hypothetical protein
MRAKRIVMTAALVAIVSGGVASAVNDDPSSSPRQTTNAPTDVFQSDDHQRRAARFRTRQPPVENPAPESLDRRHVDTCSNGPLARIVAGALGFADIIVPCPEND